MSAFPGVSSYQSSSLGSKFVVIGVVCCQEMRRYALFHKVLRGLAKYFTEIHLHKEEATISRKKIEINPECGSRLWRLLQENGIKQIELAEKLNYDPRHVSSIITGKRRLTPETAYQIANMFRVRAKWLLCQDDYRTQEEKEAASQKVWEGGQRVSAFYDKIF